jgi:membrane fusion protein, copper/silver efflux system
MSSGVGKFRVAAHSLAAVLLVFCSVFVACRRASPAVEHRAGNLLFRATLDPDPPRQQNNTLELTIEDAQGKPVESAEIAVEASMPGMAAMSQRASVESRGGGRYRARFDLSMGGTWQLDVTVKSGAGNGMVSYALTPGTRGLDARAATASETASPGVPQPAAIDHYTCSMHTNVRSDRPGKCPICSMDLVPVTVAEVESGEINVDEGRRQAIGVRTGPVVRRPLVIEVRAAGKVTYDESRLAEVSVKYPGWIGELRVDSTGQEVRRGQTLFTLYSPDLYAAQEDLLTALRSQQAARATSAPDRADYLVEASRQRLRLWDLSDREIAEIERRGAAQKYLPIPSPASGTVIEKMVVAGAAVEPGMKLYRIAGLDRVWIEADVAESDLGAVRVGQEAVIRLTSLHGREFTGRVAFLYPYLDASTRTGRVRIELANPVGELRPDMYAEVALHADRGERLVVPQSAVLFAGERRLVFLDLGGGRLRPQTVEVGMKSGDDLEVLSGLSEGDVVVTSGTFVVAAESRLKSATGQWQ